MVLSLFLPSAVEVTVDLEVEDVIVEDLAVLGVAKVGVLVVSPFVMSLLEDSPLLSLVGPASERRTVEAGLFSPNFEAVAGVRDARLAVPAASDLFASVEGLEGPFLSSPEVTEGLERCTVAAAVGAAAGRRTVEDTGGRVGGLLSVLPDGVRLAMLLVIGLVAVLELAVAVGRLGAVVVKERFGGTAVLLVGLALEIVELDFDLVDSLVVSTRVSFNSSS
jgi:hypothetical protein